MSDDTGTFTIDFASGKRYDLYDIRKRRAAFMPDNGHAWVIGAMYGLDDPEQAMDSMELNAENFVGVTAVHCLLCSLPYTTKRRFFKCPQVVS